MLNSLASIFTFAALTIAVLGVGRPLLRCFGLGENDRLTTTVFSLGIGLIAGGCVVLALGLAGEIYTTLVDVLTLIACCWGLVELANLSLRPNERLPKGLESRSLDSPAETSSTHWPEPPRWLFCGILALGGVACMVSLLGALAPPTGDAAFAGPFESAKRFAVEHRIVALSNARSTPLLDDAWYCWAMTLDGGVCAQLACWGLGVLLAAATVVFAEPLLGRRWAWIAGALVLMTPMLGRSTSGSAEAIALAVPITLALAAWWRATVHGGNQRWFVIAGIMAGGAIGVHPIAALLVLPLGISWAQAILHRTEQRQFLIRGGAVAVLIAVGVGGLLCVPSLVGFSGKASREMASGGADIPVCQISGGANIPVCQGNVGNFDRQECLSHSQKSLFHNLGIVLLAAVPGLLLARRLRGLWGVVFAAFVYVGLVFVVSGDWRLLLPAVPLLSVAAVWVWIEIWRFPASARWVAVAAFALMLACGVVESAARSRDTLLISLGMEDREDYLLRHEPIYRAAAVANRVLQPEAHILSQDPRTFYFDCRVTCENTDRRLLEIQRLPGSADQLAKHLRSEGYTHLLLAEPPGDVQTASMLPRLADGMLTLTDYRCHIADGSVCRYRLVALQCQGAKR